MRNLNYLSSYTVPHRPLRPVFPEVLQLQHAEAHQKEDHEHVDPDNQHRVHVERRLLVHRLVLAVVAVEVVLAVAQFSLADALVVAVLLALGGDNTNRTFGGDRMDTEIHHLGGDGGLLFRRVQEVERGSICGGVRFAPVFVGEEGAGIPATESQHVRHGGVQEAEESTGTGRA